MLQILTAPFSHLLRRSLKPLAAAACVVVLWPSPAAAQFFSPGPLARAHGALEGIGNCAKCHEEQKGLSARLCLDCHTELQRRVAKDAGFHGRLPAGTQLVQGPRDSHFFRGHEAWLAETVSAFLKECLA